MTDDNGSNIERLHLRQILQFKRAAALSVTIVQSEIKELTAGGARDERLDILLASALKSIRTVKAIHLLADLCLAEDISVLSRTLVETVTTACYLQFAPKSELESYRFFFIVGEHKHHLRFEEQFGRMNSMDAVDRKAFDDVRSKALSVTGRKPQSPSWTDVSVAQRAEKIDKRLGISLFGDLASTLYLDGHAFVHGTPRSLDFQMQVLENGLIDQDELQFQVVLVLHGVALALHAFSIFVNAEHKLSRDAPILEVSHLLGS